MIQRANKSVWGLFLGILPFYASVIGGLNTSHMQAGVRGTIAAVAVVGGCSALAARYFYNYWNIWNLEKVVKPYNSAKENGQRQNTKLYNWMLDTYPTAGSIKANEKAVADDLYRI